MIKADTSEIRRLVNNQGDRENAKKVILTMIGTEVVGLIKDEMTSSGSWVTGETGSKLDYKVKESGVEIVGAEYTGIALETGRKPGSMPPFEALKRWSRLKLGDEGLAYAVARKIRDKGTPAKGLLTNVFEKLLNDVIPSKIAYLTERWTQ